MSSESFILENHQVKALFPHYMLINRQMQIIDIGEFIKRLFSVSRGDQFYHFFKLNNPDTEELSFDQLKSISGNSITVHNLTFNELTLRVEYIRASDNILFFANNVSAHQSLGNSAEAEPENKEQNSKWLDLFAEKEKQHNNKRTHFMRLMAHELKTPLAAIQSSVELIKKKEEKFSSELALINDHYYDVVFGEINKMALMLRNISVFSVDQLMNFKITNSDFVALVESNLKSSFLTFFLHHKFNITVSGEARSVLIDQKLFSNVIINLVSNSIQYVTKEDKIGIAIIFHDRNVELIISDRREQMPVSMLNRISRVLNFATDENEVIHDVELGLAVVKMIMDLHKGTLQFKCNDGLTSFSVKLPYLLTVKPDIQ